MKNLEPKNQTAEEIRFENLKRFIKENYPLEDSDFDFADLINSSLDGFDVVERKDAGNETEAILTYKIEHDHHEECNYCTLGVLLIREESRGEGIVDELKDEIDKISKDNDCEYQAALADTEIGRKVLENWGFEIFTDPVNGREYYRKDL